MEFNIKLSYRQTDKSVYFLCIIKIKKGGNKMSRNMQILYKNDILNYLFLILQKLDKLENKIGE